MFYVVESSKSVAEAAFDLPPVVQRAGFVVQAVQDLAETLWRQGGECDEECRVFDVLSHRYAELLLAADMRLAAGLPWRIVIFTAGSATRISLLRPTRLGTGVLTPAAAALLQEVEDKLIQVVNDTRE